MLPNKFDQYFRDKLLDHSTKVSPSAWKTIHAGLLRHKAFHLWKWYMAGPSIVVVALTGHLILAQINKPVNTHAGAASHIPTQPITAQDQPITAQTQPVTTSAQAAPTSEAQTAATSEATANEATTSEATATSPASGMRPINPTPASDNPTTTSTIHETPPTPTTNSTSVTVGTVHKLHTTNTHSSTSAHTRREPRPRSEADPLASGVSSTEAANSTPNRDAARNQDAAQNQSSRQSRSAFTHQASGPTTRPTIVRPAIRLAITAKTPNPGSSKSLTLPSVPHKPNSRWRLDGSASPEYFSFKEFGLSYGAGARATFVFKQHFTITAGLQYLKVDVRARQKDDSLNSLFPGIFNNVQVPILFGYTTGNQRFSVGVNAGAIFSLYAEAKGRLKEYGWPNRNGVTSYLGFNFATRVNDRISLFAEPYIKCWYPQSTQDLPPQLFSTGISVGLRFDLK